LNYKADIGENPRTLEIEQMVKLMNIIAEEIYHGKYNQDLGVNRIENKLREGEDIPEEHLTAVRMSKEEIMYNWLQYIKSIINNFFAIQGKTIPSDRFFQEPFSDLLWQNIRNFTHNLASLPLWKTKNYLQRFLGENRITVTGSIFLELVKQ